MPVSKKLNKLIKDPRSFVYDSWMFAKARELEESSQFLEKIGFVSGLVSIVEKSAASPQVHSLLKSSQDVMVNKLHLIQDQSAPPKTKDIIPATNFLNESAKVDVSKISRSSDQTLIQLGDNWLKNKTLAVLLVWGIAEWKQEWLADFLPEYRVALPAKTGSVEAFIEILKKNPSYQVAVWGMSEPQELTEYLSSSKKRITRLEDGFVRSYGLGCQHTKPLSLVVDHSGGIYLNANQPSTLENLLNTFDFSKNEKMKQDSDFLLSVFKHHKISKYNEDDFLINLDIVLGVKLKKRVLVIGQVQDDASVEYGDVVGGWSDRSLILLAIKENPDADIIYKPHPDVLAGQRAGLVDTVPNGVLVLDEKIRISRLLDEVDHVYTMTSLAGFEAALRGIKVTLLGRPFYSGWGFTDDRQRPQRRKRRLTPSQVFMLAYVVYPTYYYRSADPVTSALATLIKIILMDDEYKRKALTNNVVVSRAGRVAQLDYWPLVLSTALSKGIEEKHSNKFLSFFDYRYIASATNSDFYQKVVIAIFLGRARLVGGGIGVVTPRLIQHFDAKNIFDVLSNIWSISPSETVFEQFIKLGMQSSVVSRSDIRAVQQLDRIPTSDELNHNLPKNNYNFLLLTAKQDIAAGRIDSAFNILIIALCYGRLTAELISNLADIARMKFDFEAAYSIQKIANCLDPNYNSKRGHLHEAQNLGLIKDVLGVIKPAAIACASNLNLLSSFAEDTIVDLSATLEGVSFADAIALIVLNADGFALDSVAKLMISKGDFEQAELFLKTAKPKTNEAVSCVIALSTALSYQYKLDEARSLIKYHLRKTPTLLLYREALRLATLANDHPEIKELLQVTTEKGIDVGEMYTRKAYAVIKDVENIYKPLRLMGSTKIFDKFTKGKYISSLCDVRDAQKVLVVAYFGPGDEIRWATTYQKIVQMQPHANFTFTCDPRLFSLFQRSMPDINIEPVARVRNLSWIDDYTKYDQLPSSDLVRHLDNHGWGLLQSADKTVLQMDLLSDVISSYRDFDGQPYLVAESKLVQTWRKKFAALRRKGVKIVGLNWRSSLETYSRNVHYLSLEEVEDFFSIPNTVYVNLQYGINDRELTLLKQRYPDQFIHFEDLDLFNDFENIAALMKNLDLVIAPATTMAELAGALGVKTIFMSNSAEGSWRINPNTGNDVWFDSIKLIESEPLGDKKSLVDNVKHAIVQQLFTL